MLHHSPFCQLVAAQNEYTVAQSGIEDRQLLPHKSPEHFVHGQTEKVNGKLFFSFDFFWGGGGVGEKRNTVGKHRKQWAEADELIYLFFVPDLFTPQLKAGNTVFSDETKGPRF